MVKVSFGSIQVPVIACLSVMALAAYGCGGPEAPLDGPASSPVPSVSASPKKTPELHGTRVRSNKFILSFSVASGLPTGSTTGANSGFRASAGQMGGGR